MPLLPVLAVAAFVGLWWFTRKRELFRLSVRDGKVLLVHGRIPGRMLQDISDIVSRPPVRRATIVAHAGESGSSIRASGMDDRREQRLRNVFRLYPTSALRNAPAIAKPTLGQILGIAWLGWLFS